LPDGLIEPHHIEIVVLEIIQVIVADEISYAESSETYREGLSYFPRAVEQLIPGNSFQIFRCQVGGLFIHGFLYVADFERPRQRASYLDPSILVEEDIARSDVHEVLVHLNGLVSSPNQTVK
jgi:hypothetical protein